MAKSAAFTYTYTLLLLNAEEQIVSGFTTGRDLAATRRLAMNVLGLDGRVAYVDIHHYAAHAAELKDCEPVARVTLDDEVEA